MNAKRILPVFSLLIIFVLSGCGAEDKANSSTPADEYSVFLGTVLETGETSILVEPEEGSWVQTSADKISVSIKDAVLLNVYGAKITSLQIEIGMNVSVFFKGGIAESYPAQIFDCDSVQIISSNYSPDDLGENYTDITPTEVREEIGCKILKDGQSCASYLVFEDTVYPLGEWFGGLGVVDIKTCDFNNNGVKDIIFTYSWGSGIHRALIGLFDFSSMRQSVVYNSQAENDRIYTNMNDLVLEKESDTVINVFIAVFPEQDGEVDFAALGPQKGELAGKITSKNGKVAWTPR